MYLMKHVLTDDMAPDEWSVVHGDALRSLNHTGAVFAHIARQARRVVIDESLNRTREFTKRPTEEWLKLVSYKDDPVWYTSQLDVYDD